MAKPNYPSKPCPKCGETIHARSKSHEKCGWVMAAASAPRVMKKGRKKGRKPGPKPGSGVRISLEDIQAVKALADRIGAEKVRQLAAVLGN